MQIILGSKSPRRESYLKQFIPSLQIEGSFFDEESIPYKGDPDEYVKAVACGKAKPLLKRFPDALIMTFDTAVFCANQIYNKPKNENEAFTMLSQLSGRWHTVYTGVVVTTAKKQSIKSCQTRVLLQNLNPEKIHRYQKAIHSQDKAGGYAIQGIGYLICEKIEGCYGNILGIPLNTLRKSLLEFTIDLWDYL